MYGLSILSLYALPILTASIPYQVTISSTNAPIHAAWEKSDRGRIVPLSSKARNGSIDPVVEEGLISIVGPRFANEFYKDSEDGVNIDITCWLSCPGTIAKVAPCIWKLASGGKVEDLLSCVSKKDLCNCGSCLPGPVKPAIDAICSNSAIVDVAENDRYSPYVDYVALSSSSLSLAAFRGDLFEYQVEEIKGLKDAGQTMSRRGDVHTNSCGFPLTQCGGCCCAGGCIFGSCIGVCLP